MDGSGGPQSPADWCDSWLQSGEQQPDWGQVKPYLLFH